MSRQRKLKPCQIRLQKDFDELADIYGARVVFQDQNNIQDFDVEIKPAEGIWKDGLFVFHFAVPDQYPFERPIITCKTRVWHPNIEETGAVCLNILRDNYSAVMSIGQLILGLQFLFIEPNPISPLNKEAAEQYTANINLFKSKAHEYIANFCKH